MKEGISDLDRILKEVVSFQLYKSGKEPLEGFTPQSRIKRSVWRDEGIDLDHLERYGFGSGPPPGTELLFQLDMVEVKEGLFRKRKTHRIIKGLQPLGVVYDLFGSDDDGHGSIPALARSDILFPAMLSRVSERLRGSIADLTLERIRQSPNVEISPAQLFDSSPLGKAPQDKSSDLLPLFSKTVPKDRWLRTRAGIIKDMEGLVRSVMEASAEEIESLISREEMAGFARSGIKSPRLEGLLYDISRTPDGRPESGDNFRKRLGRILLGSDASGKVFQDITMPILSRMRTCSMREAAKLERVLEPLMDPRSTPELKDLVFNAPSHNRSFIIRLMARTGDPSMAETLERIQSYSSVEEDRKEAERALRELGIDHPLEQGAKGEISRNDK
ncbi:MAG: hypothetical protein ACMUHB_00510 [Thermoplasmatota archaeon]